MTVYAGETIRISTLATDANDDPIVDTDVSSTEIVILDSDLTPVVNTTLTWSASKQYFYYDWDATYEGTFNARLRLVGVNLDTWEYRKIKIKANPNGFSIPMPPVDLDGAGTLTTKGDLLTHDGTGVDRLGIGTDGQIPYADSTETLGIKWAAPSGGGDMDASVYDPGAKAEQLATETELNAVIGTVSTAQTAANLGVTNAATADGKAVAAQITANAAIPTANLLDEDTLVSNDATKPASQQSIKAYVDAVAHTTDAADLATGVLADARVQESNVTQHQAALSITESQVSDLRVGVPGIWRKKLWAVWGQSNATGTDPTGVIDFDGPEAPDVRVLEVSKGTSDHHLAPAAGEAMIYQAPGQGDASNISFDQSFAKAMVDAEPGTSIVISNGAIGGSGFTTFGPYVQDWNPGDPVYEAALAEVVDFLAANPDYEFGGILWLQGEREQVWVPTFDMTGALETMVADARASIPGSAGTPFLVGSMLAEFVTANPADINGDHENIAASAIADAYYVDCTDITGSIDSLHYDTASLREVGKRFARYAQAVDTTTYRRHRFEAIAPGVIADTAGGANIEGTHNTVTDVTRGEVLDTSDVGWMTSAVANPDRYTLAAWVKLPVGPPHQTTGDIIAAATNPGPRLSVAGVGHNNLDASGDIGLTDGVWTHVASTYDVNAVFGNDDIHGPSMPAAPRDLELYIDGVLDPGGPYPDTATPVDPDLLTGPQPMLIGAYLFAGAFTVDALLDNVDIFPYALNAAQIAVLAAETPSLTEANVNATAIDDHVNDTAAAHAASATSYPANVNSVTFLGADDVAEALDNVDARIATYTITGQLQVDFTGGTGTFMPGDTITGQISNDTAIVISVAAGTLNIRTPSGEFSVGETLEGPGATPPTGVMAGSIYGGHQMEFGRKYNWGDVDATPVFPKNFTHDVFNLAHPDGTDVETVTIQPFATTWDDMATAGHTWRVPRSYDLDFDGYSGPFVAGEEITGGTSGAKGTAFLISETGATPVSGVLHLMDVDGNDFINNETLTSTSGATALANGVLSGDSSIVTATATMRGSRPLVFTPLPLFNIVVWYAHA